MNDLLSRRLVAAIVIILFLILAICPIRLMAQGEDEGALTIFLKPIERVVVPLGMRLTKYSFLKLLHESSVDSSCEYGTKVNEC
ncbi:hypothetical protein [Pseudothermotoga thermarum]|uniref:hypothetical protein n=1 Tax=Pseudothermotoga thermarum TaxID=119394 RepID=UPI0012FE7CAF|nr:hypothetical protein [Pseudothermotoga thermarum]